MEDISIKDDLQIWTRNHVTYSTPISLVRHFLREYQTYIDEIMDLSFNRQRNPDPIVAFETLDSLFNVLQDFNTLQNWKKKRNSYLLLYKS